MADKDLLSIAVLVACYNRKDKTMAFLDSLISQPYFQKLPFDIFLLDDSSTDGTSDAVKKKYPFVNILNGTGNLFWAASMRTIWQYAMNKKSYDLFCLFNDDVVLMPDAFGNLINHYDIQDKNGIVLIGSTMDPKTGAQSYGGNIWEIHPIKNTKHSLIPPHQNKLLSCSFGNANILLVDKFTVEKIGIFSEAYSHGVADFDYTYTAFKAGIKVLIAPGYYGFCENDHPVNWMPGSRSLKERIQYMKSPKGLTQKEYLFFIRKHFPNSYFMAFIKLWLKTLFPFIWDRFKKVP